MFLWETTCLLVPRPPKPQDACWGLLASGLANWKIFQKREAINGVGVGRLNQSDTQIDFALKMLFFANTRSGLLQTHPDVKFSGVNRHSRPSWP